MTKAEIIAETRNAVEKVLKAQVKNAVQVSEKADRYGVVYTVKYSLPGSGQVHTIMGGNKATLIASAEKHIADYEKKLSKYEQANKQKYGPA